jgi:hypothetical protein
MNVHSQHSQGQNPEDSLGRLSISGAAYRVGSDPLLELLESPGLRNSQKFLALLQADAGGIFNPLGEKNDAKPFLPAPFSASLMSVLSSSGRTTIWKALERAAHERLSDRSTKLPPVFHAALVSPDIGHFLKLLPDLRLEHGQRDPDPARVEATIWGVSYSPDARVTALLDECINAMGFSSTFDNLQSRAECARITVAGVEKLTGLMTAAMKKLTSINPDAVWSKSRSLHGSCETAAAAYIDAIRNVVSREHLPLLAGLATIRWNAKHVAQTERRPTDPLSDRGLVLRVALEAAMVNRCDTAQYRALRDEISKATHADFGVRTNALSRILEALNLPLSDPHLRFLRTLSTTAWMSCSPLSMIKRACKATGSVCNLGTLQRLRKVQKALDGMLEPTSWELVSQHAHPAGAALDATFKRYQCIVKSNLIWQTAGSPTYIPVEMGEKIGVSEVAALAPASKILAGMSGQALDLLVESWNYRD